MSESKSGLKLCPFCGDETWMARGYMKAKEGRMGSYFDYEPDWRTWEKIELAESEVPGWNALEKYIMESLKIYEGWDDGESAYAPTDKDKYLIWDFISGLICDDGFFDVVCRVNDPAQDELAWLEAWVNDLQSGMYINCVYCGHRYGPNSDVPASMGDVLKAHVEQCPKHPMSALKKDLTNAMTALITVTGSGEIEQLRKMGDMLKPYAEMDEDAAVSLVAIRTLIGLLERHPTDPSLVRVKEDQSHD